MYNGATDPVSEKLIQLIGGIHYKSLSVTKDQLDDLYHLYKFSEETNSLLKAGAERNVFRHAESDGLRMIAFVARYLSQGEDPVKFLAQLCIDAGFDVDPKIVEWSRE
jgi:hypothetical protein